LVDVSINVRTLFSNAGYITVFAVEPLLLIVIVFEKTLFVLVSIIVLIK